MAGREDARRRIVTVALVDLSVFEDDHVGSIGIHREHFLQRRNKGDHGDRLLRSANRA